MVKLSMADGQAAGWQVIYFAPFKRDKVRYKLIGKPPVPKTGVGSKAPCEFESRSHRQMDRSASGLCSLGANEVTAIAVRGFESHPIRQFAHVHQSWTTLAWGL